MGGPRMRQTLARIQHSIRPGCIWFIIGGTVGILVLASVLVVGYFSRLTALNGQPVVPELIIVGVPTETAAIELIVLESDTPAPTPSATLPAAPSETFIIGQLVIVAGTGGDGLRFRTQPGLSGTISFLAYENEVFRVEGGPQEQDGYVWWFLINPYDNSKSGWAAAVFLRPIED